MYVRSIPQSFIFPLFVLSFNFLMAICKLRTLFRSQFGISLASNRWNVVTSQWLKSCSSCNAKYSLAKSVPVCCVETLSLIFLKAFLYRRADNPVSKVAVPYLSAFPLSLHSQVLIPQYMIPLHSLFQWLSFHA